MWYETPPSPAMGPAGTLFWMAPVHPASSPTSTGTLLSLAKAEGPPAAAASVRDDGTHTLTASNGQLLRTF